MNSGFAQQKFNHRVSGFQKKYREQRAYLSGIRLLGRYGQFFWNEGDEEAARSAFTEAVVLAPNNALTHNNLAVFCWETGDLSKAVYHFRRARDLDPDDRDTIWNCGMILAMTGEYHSASYLLTTHLKKNGHDEDLSSLLEKLKHVDSTEPFNAQLLIKNY